MPRLTTAVLLLGVVLAVAPQTLPAQARVVVIVNAANPASGLSREEVARLFLKREKAWPDRKAVTVIDLAQGQAARNAFSLAVLKKPVSAVRAYWQQQIFSGRDTPPVEKGTEADVLEAVRSTPGAIGYVSGGVPLGRGVKELPITP
jgi:ABC-type phosphate transport system substrate-binding protein